MDIVDKVLWDSSYDTRQEATDEIKRLRERLDILDKDNDKLLTECVFLRNLADRAMDDSERLRNNAEQDARYLLAYHRICQKHGIAPSSSDLIAAMKEDE